jgi:N-methylhydantoinase A
VLSALGLAVASERRTGLASVLDRLTGEEAPTLRLATDRALRAAGTVGVPECIARLRYEGQGHELEVRYDPAHGAGILRERFLLAHESRYGFVLDAAVECVSVRCTRSQPAPPIHLARRGPTRWNDQDRVDDGGAFDVTLRGPAVVALPDATMHVAPGWTARTLAIGGWLLEADQ